jgi:3-deoxy-D-manno-octulosonate 8-phosphate phosphatase (KDO 8-P phosphatase)
MNKLKDIKLIILDNDGVLTDGKITYDNNRIESKNYSASDGLGIRMLNFTDIKLAIITGRESEILKQRCADLNITMLYQKVMNKKKVTQQILDEMDLNWNNVAIMGDDWNDYPVMKKAAFSAAPQNAFEDLKSKVDFVSVRKGGEGAVREFIELILKEQEKYDDVVQQLLQYLENS